jgi:PKD repeat protein
MPISCALATARHAPLRFRALLHPVALGCLVGACGGGDLVLPEGDRTLAIDVVDGDGQRGSVGEPLAAPVVVAVTDADGEPVEGATVEFALTSAGEGAGVTPSTARTNAEGRAEAQVLLGDKVGVQTGEARVVAEGDAAPTATFSALAVSDDDENRAPTADFGWSCEALDCTFTDASSDSDGSVTAWSWRFGDGATSTEREPTHGYAEPGTYTVRLTVSDDKGAQDELADEVRVTTASAPPSNQAPRADFEIDCRDLTCTFTDRSEDEDGSVERWAWDFGDGATSTRQNPSHTYGSAGRYDVVLTVTDDDGAEDGRTRTAEPDSPPAPPPPPPPPPPDPNDPPGAEFEFDCQELRCAFVDRSRDEDGTLVSWQWDFGDGATSSERNPTHVYQASGRYQVLLVVTDDDGAADTRVHTVEPQAAPSEPNKTPQADFEVHCNGLTCTFQDKSKDDDGTIVSWSWSFGDGATSNESNPVHTYAAPGKYDVLLTVTDDRGATDTRVRDADAKD